MLVKDPDDLKRRLAAAARYPDIEVSTRPADPIDDNSNPPEGTPTMADTIINDDATGAGRGPAAVSGQRGAPGTPRPGPAGPCRRNGAA